MSSTVWSFARWVTAEPFQLVLPLHRTSYHVTVFLDYCYKSCSGLRLLRSIEIASTSSASHLWVGIDITTRDNNLPPFFLEKKVGRT